MTTNYTELDAAILQAIAQKYVTASSLQAHIKTLLPSYDPGAATATALMRTIDRRLQALRKRGIIKFDRSAGGWQLVSTEGAE